MDSALVVSSKPRAEGHTSRRSVPSHARCQASYAVLGELRRGGGVASIASIA
jgi:hypothetical protein